MEVKKLEKNFIGIGEVKEFNFTQVYSSEFAYIYKVGSDRINYEVFERRNSPVCIDFEERIYSETEFKEIYPKANAFGVWAWTFKNVQSAIDKALEIESKLIDKTT
jgi:hypothetical protein